MRDFRINSLETFFQKPLPTWGGDVGVIDFQNIFYYMKAAANLEAAMGMARELCADGDSQSWRRLANA